MGFDTKTYWLTDRQSQCDFDFDLTVEFTKFLSECGDIQLVSSQFPEEYPAV
jgi:hypothetical protein